MAISDNTFDFLAGEVLLINKPLTWTSFDVVNKVRYAIRRSLQTDRKIKVGHAGTLDPLADGLLILCTGKKTKEIEQYQAIEKTYRCRMVLGKTTPSLDLETDFDSETDTSHITEAQVREIKNSFLGKIEQIPPLYSAVQVDGKRAYKAARKGQDLKLKAREVEILNIEIININLPEVYFEVRCSKGTYIRSLVRDWGEKLGVGAYMAALTRNAIGEFTIDKAWELNDLIKEINKNISTENTPNIKE
ncbi:MAG: tRNA pseudouridine(55) synthase TruB [Bernardetiaceae bacterium]|nr:tRNA pseudouridine(55) synthase TruB [Bernardetiaceae bacterium]